MKTVQVFLVITFFSLPLPLSFSFNSFPSSLPFPLAFFFIALLLSFCSIYFSSHLFPSGNHNFSQLRFRREDMARLCLKTERVYKAFVCTKMEHTKAKLSVSFRVRTRANSRKCQFFCVALAYVWSVRRNKFLLVKSNLLKIHFQASH